MKKTIFFKSFVANLSVLSVFTVLITIFTINTVKQWHIKSLINELKKESLLIKPNITENLLKHPNKLNKYVKRLGKSVNIRITVIRSDGLVVSDSTTDPNSMENHAARPEIIEALKGSFSYRIRFSTTRMLRMLYFAVPLVQKDLIWGVLRTSVYIKDIDNMLTKLNKRILVLVFILFIVSILITFFISKKISEPIKRISEASKKIEEGNFDVYVSVKDNGEVGELAKSFNSMVNYQQKLFEEKSRNQQELETVLSSINEGLAVVDAEGNIILSNDNFYKNIDYKKSENKIPKIWEIYREPLIHKTIEDVFIRKKNRIEVIKIGDLFFKTSFNLIKENNLIVITFHNITELKRLELMKKEFVLNASHELKTPLTSIKGFIETLEEDISAENKKYLDIIKRNSERLSNIISDLLLINKLEDDNDSFSNDDIININELVKEIVNIHQREAEEKSIKFVLDEKDKIIIIHGDKYKIEDMITNLINNAVKYTDKGKITVILGFENKRNAFIKITDTGIGIENKNLKRVFERFFVADKSRSRNTGGTGLGLSIVKHIISKHGGSIEVESTIGEGSTFKVILPL